MSNEDKQGLKVTDRRRFDPEGKARDESKQATAEQPATSTPEGQPAQQETTGAPPAITFSSFVMSLATQTLMQLGQIAPPPGMEIPVDKAAAQQTIDILSMLEEKSRGNLDDGEKMLIEEVLHNLRMTFIKVR